MGKKDVHSCYRIEASCFQYLRNNVYTVVCNVYTVVCDQQMHQAHPKI